MNKKNVLTPVQLMTSKLSLTNLHDFNTASDCYGSSHVQSDYVLNDTITVIYNTNKHNSK